MPRGHGLGRRFAARAVALLSLGTLLGVVPPEGRSAAAPADGAAAPGRIAFYGTSHRSLGTVALGAEGDEGAGFSAPLFPGPQHYDVDASARGDAVVWTSLRDSAEAQVHTQRGNGPVIRVTTAATGVQHPQLSPDGEKVAFAAETGRADGMHDIWIADVGGGRPRRVTDGSGDNVWPTWSPDGSRLAFSALRGDVSRYRLFTVAAAGGPVRTLTAQNDCDPGGPGTDAWIPPADPAAGVWVGAIQPAWNPVRADTLVYTCGVWPAPVPEVTESRLTLLSTDGRESGALAAGWAGWQGSWSPDGMSLAFVSHGEPGAEEGLNRIYTAAVEGAATPVLRLVEDRWVDSPGWYTPAGGSTRLLVARDSAARAGALDLSDVLPDGTDPRDLGQPTAASPVAQWAQNGPEYSPDGRRIAFTRAERRGDETFSRIWIANADGSGARPLQTQGAPGGGGNGRGEISPTWSPDGRRIAVVRDGFSGDRHRSWISVIDVASGRDLFDVDQGENQWDTEPAYAPDGRTLLLSRVDTRDEHAEIWSVRASDGGGQTDLTAVSVPDTDARTDASPAVSPDGSTIVFSTEQGYWLMNADGTGRRPLPGDLPVGGFAVWSPDGSRIAVTSRRTERPRIELVDVRTGARTVLLGRGFAGARGGAGQQQSPAWQPTADLGTSLRPGPGEPTPGELTPGERTTVTLTVRNLGPRPEPAARLTVSVPAGLRLNALEPDAGSCDAAGFACDLGALPTGATATVTLRLTATAEGSFPVVWTVSGSMADPDPADDHGSAQITVGVPAPVPPADPPVLTVAASPGVGHVGGAVTVTYTVRNTGRQAVEGLSLVTAIPEAFSVSGLPSACRSAVGCAVGDLPPGGSAVVQAVLTPTTAGRYRLDARVGATSAPTADGAVQAAATVTVLQPAITALPRVGSPGTVTLVRGTGFPPGIPVRLTWSPGITAAADPSVPGPDGSFVAQMLILDGDRTGLRTVTAVGPGFSPVTAPFLVTEARLALPYLDAGADAGGGVDTQTPVAPGAPAATGAPAAGAPGAAGGPAAPGVPAGPGASVGPVRPSSEGRTP
ncbi:hypothetical protein [Streptomyces sp. NPDC002491]